MNKITDGYQITMIWYVNDLKVSHKNPFESIMLALYLSKIYEKVIVKRGKIHNFLGMTVDYSKVGKLKVSRTNYTDKIIMEFSEKITTTSNLVAAHLMRVHDEGCSLSEELPSTMGWPKPFSLPIMGGQIPSQP